jgi:hypothetical protein
MIAERAEHGTNVTSRLATTRSRPPVIAAAFAIAGTLHPRPVRNATDIAPCSPTRWNARSITRAMRGMMPHCSSATSIATSGIM